MHLYQLELLCMRLLNKEYKPKIIIIYNKKLTK